MSTDTERLDWLISHGYTPAKWRDWTPRDGGPTPNGQIMTGQGTRAEIDAAMEREAQRARPDATQFKWWETPTDEQPPILITLPRSLTDEP